MLSCMSVVGKLYEQVNKNEGLGPTCVHTYNHFIMPKKFSNIISPGGLLLNQTVSHAT